MASAQEYANLADHVYQDLKSIKKGKNYDEKRGINIGGSNYKIDSILDNPSTGYYGAVYTKLSSKGEPMEVIIVNRGTEIADKKQGTTTDPQDLLTNAILPIGYNRQAQDALNLAKDVIADYKTIPISATGHSLGGNLAQRQSQEFGIHAETFNPYGIGGGIVGSMVADDKIDAINHITYWDPISAFKNQPGLNLVYEQKHNTLNPHTSKQFIDDERGVSVLNKVPITNPSLIARKLIQRGDGILDLYNLGIGDYRQNQIGLGKGSSTNNNKGGGLSPQQGGGSAEPWSRNKQDILDPPFNFDPNKLLPPIDIKGGSGLILGNVIRRILEEYGQAQNDASPLALDLNQDGQVKTIPLNSGVSFDIDDTGIFSKTGWIDKSDGLLVRDKNGNGIIDDAKELFGNYTAGEKFSNGFEALKELDSNNDGILNQLDDTWEELQIWQDKNVDGISQAGELKSLSQLGIASIDLNYQPANKVDTSGNTHKQISQFTFKDNSKANIEDIWFKTDKNLNLLKQLSTLDVTSLNKLVNVEFLGNINPLGLGNDYKLLSQIKKYEKANSDEKENLITQIIYDWLKIPSSTQENVNRGEYLDDGRKLMALEALTGIKFNQEVYGSNPGPNAANKLMQLFEKYRQFFKSNLEVQTIYKDLFVIDNKKQTLEKLKSHLLNLSKQNKKEEILELNKVLRGLNVFITDASDKTLIDDVYSVSQEDSLLKEYLNSNLITGTKGNDTLLGASNQDKIIIGGKGDDYLSAGSGNDIYKFDLGFGKDVIYDTGGTDTILFGSGILPKDITYTKKLDSLILDLKNNHNKTDDQIIIKNFFGISSDGLGEGVIESIKFANGKELELANILDQIKDQATSGDDLYYLSVKDDVFDAKAGDDTIYGLGGNDSIYGGKGNDKLYGNAGDDILNGGEGNDYLEGGNGNDTYVFDKNFGKDVINNYDTSAGHKDIIKLQGFSPKDVNFKRTANDLLIQTKDGKNEIKVQNYFSSKNYAIDSVKFYPNYSLIQHTITNEKIKDLVTQATDEDDYLHTSKNIKDLNAGAGNDKLYGNAGDDILNGGEGNDYLEGGNGNDTYVFDKNFGKDVINNYDTSAGHKDIIKLQGFSPKDVNFKRTANDLLIQTKDGKNEIKVQNYFNSKNYAIDKIIFEEDSIFPFYKKHHTFTKQDVDKQLSSKSSSQDLSNIAKLNNQVDHLISSIAGFGNHGFSVSTPTIEAHHHSLLNPLLTTNLGK